MEYWRSYRYKNITFFFISILIALVISRLEIFHSFLLNLGSLGYLGAFFAGVLFVSTFTVATGVVLLLILAEQLSLVEIGIIAGIGAVVGDLMIFRFVKNNLSGELATVYNHFDTNHHLIRLLHTRYFSWTLPVIGALIIASPLPDEVGVTLLGLSKMKAYQFLIISFVLNTLGIFLVVSASYIVKP